MSPLVWSLRKISRVSPPGCIFYYSPAILTGPTSFDLKDKSHGQRGLYDHVISPPRRLHRLFTKSGPSIRWRRRSKVDCGASWRSLWQAENAVARLGGLISSSAGTTFALSRAFSISWTRAAIRSWYSARRAACSGAASASTRASAASAAQRSSHKAPEIVIPVEQFGKLPRLAGEMVAGGPQPRAHGKSTSPSFRTDKEAKTRSWLYSFMACKLRFRHVSYKRLRVFPPRRLGGGRVSQRLR